MMQFRFIGHDLKVSSAVLVDPATQESNESPMNKDLKGTLVRMKLFELLLHAINQNKLIELRPGMVGSHSRVGQ